MPMQGPVNLFLNIVEEAPSPQAAMGEPSHTLSSIISNRLFPKHTILIPVSEGELQKLVVLYEYHTSYSWDALYM